MKDELRGEPEREREDEEERASLQSFQNADAIRKYDSSSLPTSAPFLRFGLSLSKLTPQPSNSAEMAPRPLQNSVACTPSKL